jgi:hypothetical protein
VLGGILRIADEIISQIDLSVLINDRINLKTKFVSKKSRFLVTIKNIFKFILLLLKTIFKIIFFTNSFRQKKSLSVCYDLTRNHLPPNISANELNDFFFQQTRRVIDPKSTNVVILTGKYKFDKVSPPTLFFQKSFLDLIITQNCKVSINLIALTKAFYVAAYFSFISLYKKKFRLIIIDIFELVFFQNSLAKTEIREIIFTDNSFYNFPAICYLRPQYRSFKTVLIHYSENSFTWTCESENDKPLWLNSVRADIHKVWTNEYSAMLKKFLPKKEINVCGSLIFRPIPIIRVRDSVRHKISIFDITPSKLDDSFGPWNLESSLLFLDGIEKFVDILNSTCNKRIQVTLKAKRRYLDIHLSPYLNFKNDLISRGKFTESNWNENIYKVILESDFVICSLGTSPALIAKEFKIPVVYYFGGKLNLEPRLVDYGIKIITTPFDLINEYKSKCF